MLSDERPKGEGSLVLKADVVIDIQTRAIGSLFTYTVPASMEVEVGCAVRVAFGHQQTVGFVCGLSPHRQAQAHRRGVERPLVL